jgi:hypothetical protein
MDRHTVCCVRTGEILEVKAGFKHEYTFNKAAENSVAEILSWGVDSTIDVPGNTVTTAELVVEEMSYAGSFNMMTQISGQCKILTNHIIGISVYTRL